MTFNSGDMFERGKVRLVLDCKFTDNGEGNWFAHEFRKYWGKWSEQRLCLCKNIYPHMLVRDGWTHIPYEENKQ